MIITTAVLSAVLGYLTEKFGEKMLDKFVLDPLADGIKGQLKGALASGDQEKVMKVLNAHPEETRMLTERVNDLQIAGLMVPPESERMRHEKILDLYAALLNVVVEVIKLRQYDLVVRGFLHDQECLCLFTLKPKGKPIEITGTAIWLEGASLEIVVCDGVGKDSYEPEELNRRMREHRTNKGEHGALKRDAFVLAWREPISSITPDFVEYGAPKELRFFGPDRTHRVEQPYDRANRLLEDLQDGVEHAYLNKGDRERLSELLNRLKKQV